MKRINLVTLLALMTACAASAPSLPDDTTSSNKTHSISLADFSASDAALTCKAITLEQAKNADKISADDETIKSNRRLNETAGYLGALFIVPLVATEGNYTEKDDITALQLRQDILRKLAAVKKCPA